MYIVPKDLTPEQFPEIGDVESQHKEYTECPFVDKVSVILMTATTTELRAVFGYLKKQAIYDTTTSGIKSYIGKYGQYHVAVGITNQGSLDACLCLREMLNSFKNAQYVISVGVCYGMDPNKEIDGKKLFFGDVIVSSNVYDSTVLKVISGEMTSRGIQSSATGKALESMFKTPIGFKLKRMVESPLGYVEGHENVVVRYGPFICNSSVIDDKDYKEKLRANKKDAIAGEMEGTGVMVATGSASRKVEAIVIKGIGDWADGTKAQSSNWKPFAAYAAASYVHHCMDRSSELLPSEHKQQ